MNKKAAPMFLVNLAWPYKELNPNHKAHWATKGKWVAQARADAYQEAQYQGPNLAYIEPETELVSLKIFLPPDTGKNSGRVWDSDNLGASMKAYQDGLFDFLKDRIDKTMDDQLIKSSINVIGPGNGEKGIVMFFIYPNTITTWIHKIPTLVGIYGLQLGKRNRIEAGKNR